MVVYLNLLASLARQSEEGFFSPKALSSSLLFRLTELPRVRVLRALENLTEDNDKMWSIRFSRQAMVSPIKKTRSQIVVVAPVLQVSAGRPGLLEHEFAIPQGFSSIASTATQRSEFRIAPTAVGQVGLRRGEVVAAAAATAIGEVQAAA